MLSTVGGRRLYLSKIRSRTAATSTSLPEIQCDQCSRSFDEETKPQPWVREQMQPYYDKQSPVVLRSYGWNFPALEKWKDLEYLLERVGDDVLCDVEVGASYNQGERLTLPFSAYIQYLCLWKEEYDSSSLDDQNSDGPPPEHLLYLAQNDMQLFPGLQEDIQQQNLSDILSHCGEGKLYSSMLWLGPRGCVSPLHYDPLDNILVQMVGRKRVTLLSRDTERSHLYCGEKYGQQYNTSAVNVESPNYDRHPVFANVHMQTTTLKPGDAIFIPSKWWHHVTSLDLSSSVNYWWR
jgi:hypothetical protein